MADAIWITARFDEDCTECEENVQAGDRCGYDSTRSVGHRIYCGNCQTEIVGPDPRKVV